MMPDAEVELFHVIEEILNDKHVASSWNYSTTADEVVDAVVAAGWTPPEPPSVECKSEIHSLDYFKGRHDMDSYWMRCDLTYPHDEHENSHTGAKWRNDRDGFAVSASESADTDSSEP